MLKEFFKNYAFSIGLLFAIAVGSVLGLVFQEKAVMFKPLGDIFLNLLFSIVVPLVFFSIASAVAGMSDIRRLGRILSWMLVIFIATGIVASLLMIIGVILYPPAVGFSSSLAQAAAVDHVNVSDQIVKAFTVPDFADLFSKKNMLALIVMAVLIGLASAAVGDKGGAFRNFLFSANEVMLKCISYIMLYAPVGLGAYFAYLVGVFGPQLLGSYLRAVTIYYPLTLIYFVAGFSLYALIAGGSKGVRAFWANIIPASLTALATGSSMATIPMNLEAARKIGTPRDIREMVIPIGATIHMDGSCLAAVLKIAFLFGVFHMDFSGPWVLATAVGVALLSGTVMSGIPGGGFLGELMIVMLYGFPLEALPLISMIGTLVDPPATMVNSIGDNVVGMMVARAVNGPKWMELREDD